MAWSNSVRKTAMAQLRTAAAEGKNRHEACREVRETFDGRCPSRSTLEAWASRAGIVFEPDDSVYPESVRAAAVALLRAAAAEGKNAYVARREVREQLAESRPSTTALRVWAREAGIVFQLGSEFPTSMRTTAVGLLRVAAAELKIKAQACREVYEQLAEPRPSVPTLHLWARQEEITFKPGKPGKRKC